MSSCTKNTYNVNDRVDYVQSHIYYNYVQLYIYYTY